jgi:hypothetical protein
MPGITIVSSSDLFGHGKNANHEQATKHNNYVKIRSAETKNRTPMNAKASKKSTKKSTK